eukprot:1193455-Prorocentrum_minimum.AAC.2
MLKSSGDDDEVPAEFMNYWVKELAGVDPKTRKVMLKVHSVTDRALARENIPEAGANPSRMNGNGRAAPLLQRSDVRTDGAECAT